MTMVCDIILKIVRIWHFKYVHFLTIFFTDFNNDNCIDKEDLMNIIDRLTQKQLQYQDKQQIIEGVSMKCFYVNSYGTVYGLLCICQRWMHLRWSQCEASFNALLLSWTQPHDRSKPHVLQGLRSLEDEGCVFIWNTVNWYPVLCITTLKTWMIHILYSRHYLPWC